MIKFFAIFNDSLLFFLVFQVEFVTFSYGDGNVISIEFLKFVRIAAFDLFAVKPKRITRFFKRNLAQGLVLKFLIFRSPFIKF